MQGGNAIANKAASPAPQSEESGVTSPVRDAALVDTNTPTAQANAPIDVSRIMADPQYRAEIVENAGKPKTALPKMSMEDFANTNSPIWNMLDYGDVDTQNAVTQKVHNDMVANGNVFAIPDSTTDNVANYFPDLRTMKKTERAPILKESMNKLKTEIRNYLNKLKGVNYEFEVNGNILDARLYDTGIREVLSKVNQDKAGMLLNSDDVFRRSEYLYSLPDYNSNPDIYRWNYFYTPVQLESGDIVGVRIAVRDMGAIAQSQIYNWGIKKDAVLDGGSPGTKPPSSGVSSTVSSDTTLDGGRRGPKAASSDASSVVSKEVSLGGEGRVPNGRIPNSASSDTSIVSVAQTPGNIKGNFMQNADLPEGTGAAKAQFPFNEVLSQNRSIENMVSDYEKSIIDEFTPTHKQYSNAESTFDAQERLAHDYEGEKAAILNSDNWGAAETVIAHRLLADALAEARAAGDVDAYQDAVAIKKRIDAMGTLEGQALQLMKCCVIPQTSY